MNAKNLNKWRHLCISCFFGIIVFFLMFFWENRENFSKNSPTERYNNALELAKKADYNEAFALLPETIPTHEERLWELQGDILFAQNADKKAIIAAYEKSFSQKNEERVAQKIALLREETVTSSESSEEKNSEEQRLQEAEKQLLEDQNQREKYLNTHNNSSENLQKNLQTIKNILSDENSTQQKDW